MRASQQMKPGQRRPGKKPDKRRISSKRAALKAIVASTAQRRRHMPVTLPTFSFQKEKDQP